jgi:predicted Holliday junction resolvase-like endonuclease
LVVLEGGIVAREGEEKLQRKGAEVLVFKESKVAERRWKLVEELEDGWNELRGGGIE